MEMQQFIQSYNIQSIVFNDFKERIIARLFKRFQIYISDEEFKNIENATIEEAARKHYAAQIAADKARKKAHKYALFKQSKKQRPLLNVF
jgi:hypothetical protein